MTMVTGWRTWGIRQDGTLTSRWDGTDWEPGINTAVCQPAKMADVARFAGLDAPARREPCREIPSAACSCGWRAWASLDDLLAGWRALAAAKARDPWRWMGIPGGIDICGLVTLSGLCGPDNTEPDCVIRGGHATVTGPLFTALPHARAAAALASRYAADVVTAAVPLAQWAGGTLAADWQAWQSDPASLESRLHRPG